MANISFALTSTQFLDQTKTVTRRLGWKRLKPGAILQGVEKCQGLKKGEKVALLGRIRVVSVRQEKLSKMMEDLEYGFSECIKEGELYT